MARPTERQREVLAQIHAYTQQHGCAPTRRELCALLGLRSLSGLQEHLELVERKGLLRTGSNGAARALALTPAGLTALGASA